MFDSPGVFYSMDPKSVLDDNWMLDASKIETLKKNKLSVLNFASEHYGLDGLDHVYHALDNASVNFLLLVHDPADHKKFDRMLFYPHWYHWAIKNFTMRRGADSLTKTYKWGCLNGVPRPHRIYNYIYSKQKPYFDTASFSFHNEAKDSSRHDDIILPTDCVQSWEKLRSTLKDRSSLAAGPGPDSTCDLPAIADSYVHFVTETTVIPKIFISEKTWKPIAAGQLFLIFGNPGTVNYLRSQGVDVFDDLIDHSYDTVQDWQQRLHQAHHQLEILISQNLQQLYVDTSQRRQKNIEKFFAGTFDQQYKSNVIDAVHYFSA